MIVITHEACLSGVLIATQQHYCIIFNIWGHCQRAFYLAPSVSLLLSPGFHWQLCVYPGQKQHSQSCSVLLQTQQPIHQLKNNNKPLKTSNWAIKALGKKSKYLLISFSFLESDNQTVPWAREERCYLKDFKVKTQSCTQLVCRQHLLNTSMVVLLIDYLVKEKVEVNYKR